MLISTGPEDRSRVLIRFPENTRSILEHYFDTYTFLLKITSPRQNRLGSFRAAVKGQPPVIRINNDLGPYSFLLVFLHELAHLDVWLNFGRKAVPHGKEWKAAYRRLVNPLFMNGSIPEPLMHSLERYFVRTPATFHRDVNLLNALNQLEGKERILILRDIPEKSAFVLPGGKTMVKLERMRTRFKCYCPQNKRFYLVPGTAQIIPIKENS